LNGSVLRFGRVRIELLAYVPSRLVVRVFLGLFMLASGIMMWMANPRPGEHLPGMQPGPLANWLQAVIDTGYLWQFVLGFKIVNGILLLIPRPVSGRRFHLLLDSGLGKSGKNRPRDRPVRPSASGSLVHLSAR